MGGAISKIPTDRHSIDDISLQDLNAEPGSSGRKYTVLERLGRGRFLRTLKCITEEATTGSTDNAAGEPVKDIVVVKVFRNSASIPLDEHVQKLQALKDQFASVHFPNIVAFPVFLKREKAGYLVRQYFAYNLRDRLHSVPFLSHIEKKWIAFQLLTALTQCHRLSPPVCHGDIKSENIMLTSWGWAYLCDFEPFKPVVVQEGDVSYFFSSSDERRTCNIAPERYSSASSPPVYTLSLTPEMDIFSAGCVIAEIFLQETVLFDSTQIGPYLQGEYDPMQLINKISDEGVRTLVAHMVQRNPSQRYSSAQKYLDQFTPEVFPHYFRILAPYIASIVTAGDEDTQIDRMHSTLADIVAAFRTDPPPSHAAPTNRVAGRRIRAPEALGHTVRFDSEHVRKYFAKLANKRPALEGARLLIPLVCSLFQRAAATSSRCSAIELLLRLAEHVDDESRLEWIVPYLVSGLTDPSPLVRVASVKALTSVVDIAYVPPAESDIFPAFIFPAIEAAAATSEPLVRLAVAECIGTLASHSLQFLNASQLLNPEVQPYGSEYYDKLAELHDTVAQILSRLVSPQTRDADTTTALPLAEVQLSAVKRAILNEVATLSVFFGESGVQKHFLPLLFSSQFRLAEDWQVRAAFFEKFPNLTMPYFQAQRKSGIMETADVDTDTPPVEAYIPSLLTGLYDPEEFVVARALNCLASLVSQVRRMMRLRLMRKTAPLMLHPNIYVSSAAIALVGTVASHLPTADVYCMLLPMLQPLLLHAIADVSIAALQSALRPRVQRAWFEEGRALALSLLVGDDGATGSGGTAAPDGTASNKQPYFQIAFQRELEARKRQPYGGGYGNAVDEIDKLIAMAEFLEELGRADAERRAAAARADSNVPEAGRGHWSAETLRVHAGKAAVHSVAVPASHPSGRVDTVYEGARVSVRVPFPSIDLGISFVDGGAPAAAAVTSPRIRSPSVVRSDGPQPAWRPRGVLVATLSEHKSAVVDVDISADGLFVVTAAADGTINIWRGGRSLFACVDVDSTTAGNQRPVLTYSFPSTRLVSMAVCEASHSVVAASESGQLQVFKVDTAAGSDKFTGTSTRYDANLAGVGRVVAVRHFAAIGGGSVVAVATAATGEVCGIDLRCPRSSGTQSFAFVLAHPGQYGLLSTFGVDAQRYWLASGTTDGTICCWDLRYNLPFRRWSVATATSATGSHGQVPLGTHRIHRIEPYVGGVGGTAGSYFAAACGYDNTVMLFDLSTVTHTCKHILRALSPSGEQPPLPTITTTSLLSPADPSPAANALPVSVERMKRRVLDLLKDTHSPPERTQRHAVRAVCSPPIGPYLLAGGTDRKIRLWDLQNVSNSAVVSGLPPTGSRPSYVTQRHDHTVVFVETPPPLSSAQPASNSLQALMPSNHHTDCVTAIKVMTYPVQLMLSASRDGAVKVWV